MQQNMVVEKSADKKAAEAAETIFKLRQKRLQIVTGDTDATYSGEAMGAAIAELTRLEEEYMTLFVGYSDYNDMAMSFDVIPDAEAESQMYIAFRYGRSSSCRQSFWKAGGNGNHSSAFRSAGNVGEGRKVQEKSAGSLQNPFNLYSQDSGWKESADPESNPCLSARTGIIHAC